VVAGVFASPVAGDDLAAGAGVTPVASMAELLDGDDTLDSLLRMLLAHRYGAGLARHGSTSPIVPHAQGSSLTVH
jgi:ferredoxin-NADP reductase